MSANSLFKDADHPDKALKQEWGIYPPEPAGRSSIVTPVSDQRPATAADPTVRQCRYCTETLPPGARECPLCLREVADPSERRAASPHSQSVATRMPVSTPAPSNPLTGMTPITVTTQTVTPAQPQAAGAVYTLESPAQCPECDTEITTIHVIRVLRTQVSFTSTLPRKAYVVTCPSCRRLLSAGLSGLL
jgi:hypothetical protein